MLSALDNFEHRKLEIDKYFQFLSLTNKKTACIIYQGKKNGLAIDSDTKIILRANAFLLLYNLVESTVQDCIEAIYSSISRESLKYLDVCEEIRKIWMKYSYCHLEKQRATHDSYLEAASELVAAILNGSVVNIDPKYKSGVSGNVDARAIRNIADKYGFSHRARKATQGGNSLVTVKENRNSLAHGDISFAECGRQHTIEDVLKIKRQVVGFMEDILRNVEKYIDSRGYASKEYLSRTSSQVP